MYGPRTHKTRSRIGSKYLVSLCTLSHTVGAAAPSVKGPYGTLYVYRSTAPGLPRLCNLVDACYISNGQL